MTTLEQLIGAWRDGSLKLPALFDALKQRGAVPDAQYRHEQAWLAGLRDSGQCDADVVEALLARLAILQRAAAMSENPAEAEATRMFAAGAPNKPAPPAAVPAEPAPPEDGTVVLRPATAAHAATPPAGEPAAAAQPESTLSGGTSGTASGSSVNTASWRRLAEAEGSEHAEVGMLLKGRFLLEREIGHGGMGVVFLARDERKVEARDRDPYVAVKVLNDEFRKHPDSLISLQRESRRSQQLAHDNIVRVYDFDKDGTIVYMTMEYIDGGSLKTLIHEEAYDGMPLAKARPLIEGMAQALGRAHRAGVVHSDFKPSNVMVTRDGVPKVFDFGIARAGKFDNQAGEQTVFDAGTLGALTPAYASLEMLQGADPRPGDDIYAFGCVLYELLTGKHPFDKLSAEVALKEGRRPPYVRSLSKRQNKALADAVAFHAAQRAQNVDDVVEGLRDIGFGERARPYLIWGSTAVVVLAVAAWGATHYLGVRHVNEVVSRFTLANPQHYANEDLAYQALVGLGSDESAVVVKHNDVIGTYLLARLAGYWDPAKKHYDYAGVQHVYDIRDKLKLYSPQLDVRRSVIEQERNGSLNMLDTQLSERTAAGALFKNQPDNVVETLAAIRAIDPKSSLLDNAELKLKYDIVIGQTLDAGKLDEAQQQLAQATQLFPHAKRLQQRAAQLATLQQANAAKLTAANQSVPQAREALAKLLAAPSLTPAWQAAVAGNLKALQDDHSAQTQALVQKLPDAVAGQAAVAGTPAEVRQASNMVAMALVYAPQSKPLLAQRDRLAALQQQQQAQLATESDAAEVTSRVQSLKSAAAAHDVEKATESLARIRSLQPDNPFLKTDGPRLLADAYIGQANSLAEQGKFRAAADALDKGAQDVGSNRALVDARARMDFVADLMSARGQTLRASDIQRFHNRLAGLDKADPDAVGSLQQDLKVHGVLPGGSFAAVLASLKPAVANAGPTWAQVNEANKRAAEARRQPAQPYVYGHPSTPVEGRSIIPPHSRIARADFDRFCVATRRCSATGGRGYIQASAINADLVKAYETWLAQSNSYTYRLPADTRAGRQPTRPAYGNCDRYGVAGDGYGRTSGQAQAEAGDRSRTYSYPRGGQTPQGCPPGQAPRPAEYNRPPPRSGYR
ncbi:MAG TPA: serine/threonine-protein kinase [Rhodanobacteraceae bacterium]|nr:serine/threonine-protein kinase [Rhodanobacteraceae bacterium]